MAITRWSPTADPFAIFERRIQKLFDQPFRLPTITEDLAWSPSVEISETENAIEVSAELPGVAKEDVEVHLENNVLTIRGHKKEEKEEKEKERYVFERYFGAFHRSLTLPATVDEGNVKAEFKDGILEVHLEKTAAGNGKKIPIM